MLDAQQDQLMFLRGYLTTLRLLASSDGQRALERLLNDDIPTVPSTKDLADPSTHLAESTPKVNTELERVRAWHTTRLQDMLRCPLLFGGDWLGVEITILDHLEVGDVLNNRKQDVPIGTRWLRACKTVCPQMEGQSFGLHLSTAPDPVALLVEVVRVFQEDV